MRNKEQSTLFERLKKSMEESIAFSRGELDLKVTQFPMPPADVHPKTIIRIRESLKLSQMDFAGIINVSTKTLQNWELGKTAPKRASLRLLQILEHNPKVALDLAYGVTGMGRKFASRHENLKKLATP